jgi:hypothetical protein
LRGPDTYTHVMRNEMKRSCQDNRQWARCGRVIIWSEVTAIGFCVWVVSIATTTVSDRTTLSH